jgi:hypothetical protein
VIQILDAEESFRKKKKNSGDSRLLRSQIETAIRNVWRVWICASSVLDAARLWIVQRIEDFLSDGERTSSAVLLKLALRLLESGDDSGGKRLELGIR